MTPEARAKAAAALRAAADKMAPLEDEAPEDEADDDLEGYWSLPPRDEIETRATTARTVEILQISPRGESENQRIDVPNDSAVAVARMILWAAGFHNAHISTCTAEGFVDLDDGDTADSIYSTHGKPRRRK